MTRIFGWALLLICGGFFLFSVPTSAQLDVNKNQVFFLNSDWYQTNQSLQWEHLLLDFGTTQPVGRLALAIGDLNDTKGLDGEILSSIYYWQFLDNQPIELIHVKVDLINPTELNPAVYVNTDGMWKKVSSKHNNFQEVEFNIQSLKGKFVVTGSEVSDEIVYEETVASEVIVDGYTIDTPDQKVRIGIMPKTLEQGITAKIRELPGHYSINYLDKDLKFASGIYHIWLDSPEQLKFSRNYPIEIEFFEGNDELKNIYYFDPSNNTWHPSPSATFYDLGRVRTITFQSELILAVVADPSKKERGQASWFSSSLTPRNIYGSANNDYPIGTILRVTNLLDGDFFDTEVISRGPYVNFRIIDLTSEAFKQISTLGTGVIEVKIEPLDMIIK